MLHLYFFLTLNRWVFELLLQIHNYKIWNSPIYYALNNSQLFKYPFSQPIFDIPKASAFSERSWSCLKHW